MLSLKFLPLELFEDPLRNIIVLRQLLTADPDDHIDIGLSYDQAEHVGRTLMKFAKHRTPALLKPTDPGEFFETWWFAYPGKRRVDKSACKRKWIQKNLDQIAPVIIDHTRKMAVHPNFIKEDYQFTPMTTTYLNQSRWETPLESADAQAWVNNLV